jgi:NAD(P)H-dependent flavin oxidoreductase YrpB (nitropropane dioxygenase family)
LRLGSRTLLPIVQGGMGVGVSAHRLAGSVATLGAVGTISSVDPRRHHADLMALTHDLAAGAVATQAAKVAINAANLEALEREIRAARALAGGRGLLAFTWRIRPVVHARSSAASLVVAKLTRVQVAGTSGFPSSQVEAMSLARLIAMARSLALLHVAATKEPHPSEAERAARMFSRWPNNLHSALRNLAAVRGWDLALRPCVHI